MSRLTDYWRELDRQHALDDVRSAAAAVRRGPQPTELPWQYQERVRRLEWASEELERQVKEARP